MKARCSLLGQVGVAVIPHPARPGEQFVEPPHVSERHLADDDAEEFGPQRIHAAHEQAAVAAPLDAEPGRRRHLAGDQVLGHGGEILVSPQPLLLEGGLMPGWAKLAAAADVGDHVGTDRGLPRRSRHPAGARAAPAGAVPSGAAPAFFFYERCHGENHHV